MYKVTQLTPTMKSTLHLTAMLMASEGRRSKLTLSFSLPTCIHIQHHVNWSPVSSNEVQGNQLKNKGYSRNMPLWGITEQNMPRVPSWWLEQASPAEEDFEVNVIKKRNLKPWSWGQGVEQAQTYGIAHLVNHLFHYLIESGPGLQKQSPNSILPFSYSRQMYAYFEG